MEQMIEHPQPPEGDEATTGTIESASYRLEGG